MAPYSLSDPAVFAFILIPSMLVLCLAWGLAVASRRTGDSGHARARVLTAIAAAILWMAVTWMAAASGVLRQWDALPPPFALLFLSIVGVSCWIGLGPWGRRLATGLPLWVLVGVQGFRLPLELAMHEMAERGVMPEQMSYSGWNFDIVTGASALVVAALVASGRSGPWLVRAWNVMGLLLLANIVTIALASTPVFAAFGEDRLNVWVTYPPFVWLPAVMVTAALAGHLIVWRAARPRTSASRHA